MILCKIRGIPRPVTLLKKCALPVPIAELAGKNAPQYYLLRQYCYPEPRHCDVLLYRNGEYLCNARHINWSVLQLRTSLYIYDLIDAKPEGACC